MYMYQFIAIEHFFLHFWHWTKIIMYICKNTNYLSHNATVFSLECRHWQLSVKFISYPLHGKRKHKIKREKYIYIIYKQHTNLNCTERLIVHHCKNWT